MLPTCVIKEIRFSPETGGVLAYIEITETSDEHKNIEKVLDWIDLKRAESSPTRLSSSDYTSKPIFIPKCVNMVRQITGEMTIGFLCGFWNDCTLNESQRIRLVYRWLRRELAGEAGIRIPSTTSETAIDNFLNSCSGVELTDSAGESQNG